MPTLHYRLVDVFSDRPFAGNPLAVVLDADDVDSDDLARIAREFNLSETAFPLQPSPEELAAGADYRLRIFTPRGEIPFAGHPSVGAAWVMAALGRVTPGVVRQACGAGILPLDVAADRGPVELTSGTPTVGKPLSAADALAAASLPASTPLVGPVLAAGVGVDFGFLHLADERDVGRATPDLTLVRGLEPYGAAMGLYLFVWDSQSRTAHARMFSASMSSGEDPATGSAALALGAYLVHAGLLPGDGQSQYVVRQGAEMGRPSRLECTVVAQDGAAVRCTVTGAVAPVASGEIRRPTARR